MSYNVIKINELRFREYTSRPTKGTRRKRILEDIKKRKSVFLKYCAEKNNEYRKSTELASEKIAHEIAKKLGYKSAEIELAKDQEGKLCILNYDFLGTDQTLVEFVSEASIDPDNDDRRKKYTIQNIKNTLEKIDKKLYLEFIKLQIFDALIGEGDRHEENWGYIRSGISKDIIFAPFYDNGDSLMHNIPDEKIKEYQNNNERFLCFINKSRTSIFDIAGHKFKHFQLIDYLINENPSFLKTELKKINILTNDIIEEIVNGIPDEFLTHSHKSIVQQYIKIRREILIKKVMSEK